MKAIKNKDIINREPEKVPDGEKKVAQKTKSFDQTPKPDKSEQTAVNVNDIAAFKKSKLPEEDKQMIVNLHQKMEEHNSGVSDEGLKDIVFNAQKFDTGHIFYGKHEDDAVDGVVPYTKEDVAKVFINEDGELDYEVIPEHLDKFDTDADEVDEVITNFILTPTYFEMNGRVYSFLNDPDMFMQILSKLNGNIAIGLRIDGEETVELTVPIHEDDIEGFNEVFKPNQSDEEPAPKKKREIDGSDDEEPAPEPEADPENEEDVDEG